MALSTVTVLMHSTERDVTGYKDLRESIRKGLIVPGNQIIIPLDGCDSVWDVIGKDCEDLVDTGLEHSITIQLHGLLEERPFDETGDWGCNRWATSDIREYLNGVFKERFSKDFIGNLAIVRKGNSNGEQTEDVFFLLSKEEYTPGKTPYQYYEDQRNRVKFNDDGYSDWHWTRSAYRGDAYYTWNVSSTGYVYNYGASTAFRFSPACVIGA